MVTLMFQAVEHLFTAKDVILIVGAFLGFAVQWGIMLGWKREVSQQHKDFKDAMESMEDRVRTLEDNRTDFALLKNNVETLAAQVISMDKKLDVFVGEIRNRFEEQQENIMDFYKTYGLSRPVRKQTNKTRR